MNKEGQFYN